MIFSSLLFIWYFLPVFLLLYFFAPKGSKNIVALLGSCFFYAWGAPEFFLIILPSLVIDFYLVRLTALSQGKLQKWLHFLNLFLIITLLLIAKYLNFFVENINEVVEMTGNSAIKWKEIILPIGISFITFQRISYVMDCKSGKTKPLTNFQDYALYILLFPQLIAGPIIRFNEIAAQIKERSQNENIDNRLNGLFRFIIGLSKKVLIADTIGFVVDGIFALPPDALNATTAWVGIIAYSFQIYYDFSGYSDMAIGLSLMLGFRFPENFNFPYISQSITEFWRRWHITLGTWMRDYLYIPLGGNRVSQTRLFFNLWTVFLFSGLWHGAAWTFIIWGGFHGLFLIFDRLFLISFYKKIGKIPSIFITYFIVLIGWVFFRADTISDAFQYIGYLFSFDFSGANIYLSPKFWFYFGIAIFFAFFGVFPVLERKANALFQSNSKWVVVFIKFVLTLLLGMYCLMEIMASNFNPFIYFRF